MHVFSFKKVMMKSKLCLFRPVFVFVNLLTKRITQTQCWIIKKKHEFKVIIDRNILHCWRIFNVDGKNEFNNFVYKIIGIVVVANTSCGQGVELNYYNQWFYWIKFLRFGSVPSWFIRDIYYQILLQFVPDCLHLTKHKKLLCKEKSW